VYLTLPIILPAIVCEEFALPFWFFPANIFRSIIHRCGGWVGSPVLKVLSGNLGASRCISGRLIRKGRKMDTSSGVPNVKLNNGLEIPIIGLGTWKLLEPPTQ